VCGARFLAGQTCVIGKSMFLRRQALEGIGGFQSAGHYLAEDYVIGQAVVRAGYWVVTASQPVPAWHEGLTFGRFISRHLRWAVMRHSVSRSAYRVQWKDTARVRQFKQSSDPILDNAGRHRSCIR
jgi:cellulose synthase/poly-beta-1,6-N-acetylglucosamine synthase-like glycosyltransferase